VPSCGDCSALVSVTKAGSGVLPAKGAKITVHCTGYLKEGMKKFWSTKDPGQRACQREAEGCGWTGAATRHCGWASGPI